MKDDLMHWEDRFREKAAKQGGVVGIGQLRALDCTGDQWGRARRSPRWDSPSRRVLRVAGSPVTDEARLQAAVLDAGGGAVLHGATALAWMGLSRFDLRELHIVRRRETTRSLPRLASLHRLRDLSDDDVIVVRGVPTVTAIRAIWSEASRYSSPRLFERGVRLIGRILDDAHVAGLVTWEELHRSIDRLARRGRAGTRIMRELARVRLPGQSPTESGNEDRFEELLRRERRPPLERQVVVGGRRPVGRCDFRDPELPVVVEVNSLRFHSSPSDEAADRSRYDELVESGLHVAVVWDRDLWSAPYAVIEVVDKLRRNAARGRPPSVLHTPGCPWPTAGPDRLPDRRPDTEAERPQRQSGRRATNKNSAWSRSGVRRA